MKLNNMQDAVKQLDQLIDDLRYPESTQSPLDQMSETSLHLEVIRDWLESNYE